MLIAIAESQVEPVSVTPEPLNLICLLASAIWAAVVCFLGWPGSAVVLSFALPFVLMLRQAMQSAKNRAVNFALLCAGAAILGVAIEPGWFNMIVAWGLLLGTSFLLRKDESLHALNIGWNAVLHTLASPFHFIKSMPSILKLSGILFRYVPRLPGATIALPLITSLVFLALLSMSNPLIALALSNLKVFEVLLRWIKLTDVFSVWVWFILITTAVMFWPMLQPTAKIQHITMAETGEAPQWHKVFFKPSAVATTLVLLNLLFAVQNILDVKYVWFTGEVPAGLTHAQYAHKGAYSLIVTALLAAVFVVFALRKDTAAASSKTVRGLVFLWIAQNVALVASSAWRTLSYVDDMGWTEWRVSALIWMGLVCFGLASVVWRVWKNLSALWLVNMNIAAAAVLLALCAPLDIKAFVANRNIDRAITQSNRDIDYGYFQTLGVNALPALVRYRAHIETLSKNAQTLRELVFISSERTKTHMPLSNLKNSRWWGQEDWRTWTLRRALMVINP